MNHPAPFLLLVTWWPMVVAGREAGRALGARHERVAGTRTMTVAFPSLERRPRPRVIRTRLNHDPL